MSDTPHTPPPFDPDGDAPSADAFFGGEPAFEPAIEPGAGADAFFEGAAAEPDFAALDPGPAVADAPSGDGAAEPAQIAKPSKKKDRKAKPAKARKSRGGTTLLGVHVMPQSVHGVLVREAGDGRYDVLRRFTRNRSAGEQQDFSGATTPGDAGGLDLGLDDASIQFGSSSSPDFSGEFAGLQVPGDMGLDTTLSARSLAPSQPIVFELRDMLDEAEASGIDRPSLTFAIEPPDVDYVELIVPEDKKAKKAKKAKDKKGKADAKEAPVKRDQLLALLKAADAGEVDKDRVAFLPMTSRDGKRRFLAIVPTPSDAVVPSVAMLREQARYRKTAFKSIQAEVPLLLGLAEMTAPTEPNENTAVVRVGAEDTLVLLLSGGVLHHVEQMQSVTAYDGPDTICSRVLLQQDVQGIGTVHNVVVLADEREDDLVQGFAAFYPDAQVQALRGQLAAKGLATPSASGMGAEELPSEAILATAAALAELDRKNESFPDVNLLPRKLRKRKRGFKLAVSWHTLVTAALLFMSVVYFVGVYIAQKNDITDAEQRLAEFPPEAKQAVPQLQMRIDSLRMAQAQMTASLATLDSLLFGTDRWTQDIVRTARAASAAGGVWFEDWSPQGNDILLHGFATSRSRVVGLAQRLDATIEELTYQSVRDYPVFEYRLKMSSPVSLPQTSIYLREQIGDPLPAPPQVLPGLDAPAPVPSGAAPLTPAEPAEPTPVEPEADAAPAE